jgi:hypothetical protein
VTLDLDIFRTPKLLVDKHGEDAPIHAAMRADELLDKGYLEGRAVWKRVLWAPDELLARNLLEGEGVHLPPFRPLA